MKRWIYVLLMMPSYLYAQHWTNQISIPMHFSAYQKNQSSLIGLRDLPALLGYQKSKEIGVATENKYSLSILSTLYLSMSHPLGSGNISLNGNLQGGTLYSHFYGNINYGLPLNRASSMGISIGYTYFKLKNNTPEFFVQTIAGIAQLINDKTLLAIHYEHAIQWRRTSTYKNFIPNGLIVGIGHQLSGPIFVQLELRKKEQLQLLPTFNWKPNSIIEFWCGLSGSGQMAVGIIGHAKSMATGIALSNHPHLGYAVQLQINKRFYDKE